MSRRIRPKKHFGVPLSLRKHGVKNNFITWKSCFLHSLLDMTLPQDVVRLHCLCLRAAGENRAVLHAYHTPWPHRASSNPAHLTKELQCHAAPCHVVCVCGGVDGALSTCILNTSGRVLCGSAHAPGRAARSCLTYRRRLKHCSHLSMATWWQRFDVRASGIMSGIERCHRTF